jgi:hypothetical protein
MAQKHMGRVTTKTRNLKIDTPLARLLPEKRRSDDVVRLRRMRKR